jgi:pimeloyl-[acyl-carrier protein] methyl ester esterase
MDGTGNLFADFVKGLPGSFETEVVRYPNDYCLSYPNLMNFVRSAGPVSEPFVLVAESFSTPLAIQFAATKPPNLKGLVLCAGFASSPLRGWRCLLGSLFSPFVFRLPLSDFAAKLWLVGPSASPALLSAVKSAISSVQPRVLSARLRAVLNCDARKELTQVAVPILYLQAQQDRLVPASSLEEIRRIKPQTFVAEFSGPHLLFQREPQQTAEIVAKFIRQLE